MKGKTGRTYPEKMTPEDGMNAIRCILQARGLLPMLGDQQPMEIVHCVLRNTGRVQSVDSRVLLDAEVVHDHVEGDD